PLMGVPFGWAKPVPVNPARFSRKVSMNTGMMITATAGPASNLVLAILCIVAKIVLIRAGVRDEAVWWLVSTGFWLNVILAFFNMLPIPPLDGSRVVDGLMPYRLRPAWERIARYGPLALLAVIVLPRMFSFSLFSGPLRMANDLANAMIRAALGV
ncbi:MAG: site-2 protease family protein, partial [Myxococcales bacterium]